MKTEFENRRQFSSQQERKSEEASSVPTKMISSTGSKFPLGEFSSPKIPQITDTKGELHLCELELVKFTTEGPVLDNPPKENTKDTTQRCCIQPHQPPYRKTRTCISSGCHQTRRNCPKPK